MLDGVGRAGARCVWGWAELVVGKDMDLGGMLSGAGAKEARMGFSLAHWGMSSFEILCVLDGAFFSGRNGGRTSGSGPPFVADLYHVFMTYTRCPRQLHSCYSKGLSCVQFHSHPFM